MEERTQAKKTIVGEFSGPVISSRSIHSHHPYLGASLSSDPIEHSRQRPLDMHHHGAVWVPGPCPPVRVLREIKCKVQYGGAKAVWVFSQLKACLLHYPKPVLLRQRGPVAHDSQPAGSSGLYDLCCPPGGLRPQAHTQTSKFQLSSICLVSFGADKA
jgi:hypothetical protein